MESQFNKFVTYNLTPEESNVGSTFNVLQLAVLQNRRAEIALSLINNTYDPSNPLKFAQAEAELRGQMGVLDWLFEIHDVAIKELAENQPLEIKSDQSPNA